MGTAGTLAGLRKHEGESAPKKPKAEPAKKSGPARAYQFGNTIIVEDEDGEVIKKYDISAPGKNKKEGEASFADPHKTMQRMQRMGSYLGVGGKPSQAGSSDAAGTGNAGEGKARKGSKSNDEDDDRIRFTVSSGGQRMSKDEFIQQIRQLDPKTRAKVVEASDVPEAVKQEARADAKEHVDRKKRVMQPDLSPTPEDHEVMERIDAGNGDSNAEVKKINSNESAERGPEGLTLVDSNDEDIPFHNVGQDLNRHSNQATSGQETAAERRRREARLKAQQQVDDDSEDDGTERIPPKPTGSAQGSSKQVSGEEGETAAERRRRIAALGVSKEESDSSEDESNQPRQTARPGIRFADEQPPSRDHSTAASGKRKAWPKRLSRRHQD